MKTMRVNELKTIAMNDMTFIYLDKEGRAIYPPSDMNIDNLKVIGIAGKSNGGITCYVADEDSNYTIDDCN